MERLQVPNVGDPITKKWAKDVVDEINRQEIVPQPGIHKQQTAKGTVLRIDRPKKATINTNISIKSGVTMLARIVGGDAMNFWTVNLYPNGMNGSPYKNSNGTVYTLYATANDLAIDGKNLIGRWCFVTFYPCSIIVGEDF